MTAEASYLQFPLCALAWGKDVRSRLEHVISFGVVDAGHVMFDRLNPETREMKACEFAESSDCPEDYDEADPDRVAAMLGAEEIGITFGREIDYAIRRWETLTEFKSNFESRHGRDVRVRVAKDLVFEARDNTGISYREFAVLCATYSCIGAKSYPVRITRQKIQCRMLGYKSPSIMQTEIGDRIDGAKPLTFRQINYTLDALHKRQFFARARANERQTFYSHRLTQETLEARLLAGKSYSEQFHQRRRQRDAELIKKVKQAKRAIKVDAPIKADTAPDIGSNYVRSASTGGSAECPLNVHFNKNTPNRNVPNKNTPIETLSNTACESFPVEEEGRGGKRS